MQLLSEDKQLAVFRKWKGWLFSLQSMKNLGAHSDKSIHLAIEWIQSEVRAAGERSVAKSHCEKKLQNMRNSKLITKW